MSDRHPDIYNEFDLEAARKAGQAYERERIIKVAQNRICFDHQQGCDHAACYALSDLIALIKGEQK